MTTEELIAKHVVQESMEDYLNNTAKGSSDIIKISGATPLEWITNVHLAKGDKKSTSSQTIGTLVHAICENVTLDVIDKLAFIKLDERKKGNKEINELQRVQGRQELNVADLQTVLSMGKNILNNSTIHSLLTFPNLKHEQSIYVNLNGLPVKIRPDICNFVKHYMISVKTTQSLSYEGKDGFQREMDRFNYWAKECFYAMVYYSIFGVYPTIYMLVSQNQSPYDCYIMQLDLYDLKAQEDFVNGCISNVLDVLRDYEQGNKMKGLSDIYGDTNGIIKCKKYDWKNN